MARDSDDNLMKSSDTVEQRVQAAAQYAVLDYQGAMRRLGDDEELFREFVGFYDEDCRVLLDKIRAAVQQRNASGVQQHAHGLKGLAANLGATEVATVAALLEESGKSAELSATPSQLEELSAAVSRLDVVLERYRGQSV